MDEQPIRKGLEGILNRHGYGFHYSVLRLAHELSNQNRSDWHFKVAEFPVQVPDGPGTRIDFVLRQGSRAIYLIAECKRANPALSNWCFVRAPYVRRNAGGRGRLFVERVDLNGEQRICASAPWTQDLGDATYHIAVEVKSSQKGDPCGSGRGAIEAAATQVCRGLNGMVQCVAANRQLLEDSTPAYFLPVIFTTAKIWTSDVDLGAADIRNGAINLEDTDFRQVDWVYYQYHLSPGIKHSHSPAQRPKTIEDLLDSEYIRTIAVVSASGIRNFLSGFDWLPRYLPSP